MSYKYCHIPYAATNSFSQLVTDYLGAHPSLKQFYTFTPNKDGIEQAIESKSKMITDRQRLVSSLQSQYQDLNTTSLVQANIKSLLRQNTFTITTAHQPNLMTGYLYFIYKILHAIKLAEDLNGQYPEKHFVPVYYMGSEDNDLEELGVFRFRGEKHRWDGAGQQGAVGRMHTATLKPLLQQVFKLFGPPGKNCDDLIETLNAAYLKHATIGTATKFLVNELFGQYGLVIVDPDDRELKKDFIPVMEDDLLNHTTHKIVSEQSERLAQQYKTQAFPRPINLFYLEDGSRERIESHGDDNWVVLNTGKTFTKAALLEELHTCPEKFSPNVILRGLFQSTILPDVAFIGGGAEVAYWLQLKTIFSHYNVFYPVIILRQSVQWMHESQTKLRHQCNLSITDVFKPTLQLENEYVTTHAGDEWQTIREMDAVARIMSELEQKATHIDATLAGAAKSAIAKIQQQLATLQKKMLRAEKRKMTVGLQRIQHLKASLFPNGSLQERTENFAEYYLEIGPEFFDIIKNGIDPLGNMFLVIEQ